ncbi:YhgE/Pip domain-containing protein [Jeotgalibacillus sp. S-D1]|uniref:YhgE/Pip domain-containing protein n=1 Tax=Jeotgalibacillus sp. S-D1 TaxID=2552189 RepID=UPI001F109963|nr:YhgE/Pip domain-containing protein [Jeotgalibacillus sp. S-D1]
MKLKRTSAAFTAFLLVMPTFVVSAETNQDSKKEDAPKGQGSYTEKSEVVYATLNASGGQGAMYVVNNFTIDEPGKISDYGPYTSVQNLTDPSAIQQKEDRVQFTTEEEEFYYQGDLKGVALPWDFDVAYRLEGKSVKPEDLLGKDGELEIQIDSSKNDKGEELFFENYLLQITLTFDSERYKNIEAPDGTIANAGKNRQVTFTAMPEKEESFTIKTDVSDLEMEAIEIAAVPSSMSIDAPDADDMQKDMTSLSDATAEINYGVGELKNGIAELNNGAASLYDGSAQYQQGINELQGSSAGLVEGSASIQSALQQVNESVQIAGSGGIDVSQFTELENGLREFAGGLEEIESGLTNLNGQYSQAHQTLDETIKSIPAEPVSEADIQALYDSGADQEVVDRLVQHYEAARATRETYAGVQEAFNAINPALETSSGSLNEMSANVYSIADELNSSLSAIDVEASIAQLQDGLQTLTANYNNFHSGLVAYTGGVEELAGSYQQVHNGISGLTGGTSELEAGSAELQNGTSQLASSTSDLPDQLQKEIDDMISEYDKSDFEPVSFVSDQNEKVETVQFVIKTESIKNDEKENGAAEDQKEKSFWDRLKALFN